MLRYYTPSPQMIPDHVLFSDWLHSSRDYQTCPRWQSSSLCRQQQYNRPHRQFTPQFADDLVDLVAFMQLLDTSNFEKEKKNKRKHENELWKKTVHLGEDRENVTAKLVDGTIVISTKIDTGCNEYTEVNRVVKLPQNIDVDKVRICMKEDDDVVQIEAPYKIHQNEQENEQAKNGVNEAENKQTKNGVEEAENEQTVELAGRQEVNEQEKEKINEKETECSEKETDEQLKEQSTEASEQSTSANVGDKSIH